MRNEQTKAIADVSCTGIGLLWCNRWGHDVYSLLRESNIKKQLNNAMRDQQTHCFTTRLIANQKIKIEVNVKPSILVCHKSPPMREPQNITECKILKSGFIEQLIDVRDCLIVDDNP